MSLFGHGQSGEQGRFSEFAAAAFGACNCAAVGRHAHTHTHTHTQAGAWPDTGMLAQLQGSPAATGAGGSEDARVRSISKHEASNTSPKGGVRWGEDSWAPAAPPGSKGVRPGSGSSAAPLRERSSDLHSYFSRPRGEPDHTRLGASAEEDGGSVVSGASRARTSAGTSQAGSEFSDSRLMGRYLESKRMFRGVSSAASAVPARAIAPLITPSFLAAGHSQGRGKLTCKSGQVDAKAQYAQAVQKIDRCQSPPPRSNPNPPPPIKSKLTGLSLTHIPHAPRSRRTPRTRQTCSARTNSERHRRDWATLSRQA